MSHRGKVNIYSNGGTWNSTGGNKINSGLIDKHKNIGINLNGASSRDKEARKKDHFILQQLKKSTSQTY